MSIVDKNVDVARLTGANKQFIMQEIPHLERLLVRDPADAADGAGIVVVSHVDAEAIAAIRERAVAPLIVDLQGVDALKDIPNATYEGICW